MTSDESVAAIRRKAIRGLKRAQHEFGRRYVQGIGVPENRRNGFKWWLRAASRGYVPSMAVVGVAYLLGCGVRRDEALARRWLKRAARKRSWFAREMLKSLCPKRVRRPRALPGLLKLGPWQLLSNRRMDRIAADHPRFGDEGLLVFAVCPGGDFVASDVLSDGIVMVTSDDAERDDVPIRSLALQVFDSIQHLSDVANAGGPIPRDVRAAREAGVGRPPWKKARRVRRQSR